jgi:hypothetical protein
VVKATVSIVIRCFNHDRYVGEAIDSSLAQSWPDTEVVVVDDGSTDNSAAVIRRRPGVRLVQQTNRGLAAARNAGLAACRGDVVIFLDADDRLWPDAARTAMRVLAEHPDAGMVFGRCQVIDAAGHPLPSEPPPAGPLSYHELLRRNHIWTPAMAAFRRTVLHSVGTFNPQFNPSADYDMYLRVAQRFPVWGHDATVADYRQHGGNMSADPLLMLRMSLAVLRSHAPHAMTDPALAAAYDAGVSQWRAFYGERLVERFRTALRRGDLRDAARDAWHLLRWHPGRVQHHLARKLSVAAIAIARWARSSSADV